MHFILLTSLRNLYESEYANFCQAPTAGESSFIHLYYVFKYLFWTAVCALSTFVYLFVKIEIYLSKCFNELRLVNTNHGRLVLKILSAVKQNKFS